MTNDQTVLSLRVDRQTVKRVDRLRTAMLRKAMEIAPGPLTSAQSEPSRAIALRVALDAGLKLCEAEMRPIPRIRVKG